MNPLATAEFFIHLKQFEKAKIVLDLLKPYAHSIRDIDQLGKLYADIREFTDSLELAHKIYAQVEDPESKFDARVNIIRAHLNLNQPKEALVYININDRVKLNDHPNNMDKSMCYFLLDRKDEAEKILRKILTEEPTEDIKCIADFGTNIGDNLCCGQSGVLTDTKYVCPANYSKCESMKCGSKYGTCVKA